ncbi:Endonuclease-reverse transcriptase [Popillia japonica]
MPELSETIKTLGIQVLMLNETRTSAAYKIRLRGFQTEHLRINGVNGGVAVLVRNDVPYNRMHIRTPILKHTEVIAIQFADGTILAAVYNSPQKKITSEELNALFSLGHKVILAGDFNATHANWNCNKNNANGNTLYKFINDNNVMLHTTYGPTHVPHNGTTPNTLCTQLTGLPTCRTMPHTLPSDHVALEFHLGELDARGMSRRVYDYGGFTTTAGPIGYHSDRS